MAYPMNPNEHVDYYYDPMRGEYVPASSGATTIGTTAPNFTTYPGAAIPVEQPQDLPPVVQLEPQYDWTKRCWYLADGGELLVGPVRIRNYGPGPVTLTEEFCVVCYDGLYVGPEGQHIEVVCLNGAARPYIRDMRIPDKALKPDEPEVNLKPKRAISLEDVR